MGETEGRLSEVKVGDRGAVRAEERCLTIAPDRIQPLVFWEEP